MKKYALPVLLFTIIIFTAGTVAAAEKEKIRVAGSGGMIPLVTELAKAYMAENSDTVIAVSQSSIQSAGGIMGAAKGELEIGMANRPLKEEEQSLGLETADIARVGVVVGVNKSLPIREISSENLCKVYEGKIKKWSELGGGDGMVVALTKSEKDATKETVRKNIACFRNLKEAETVLLVPTSPQTAKTLSNSKAIGFTATVDVEASNGAIVALKLDGVEPTVENIRSGKYKVVQGYRLVTKGKPAGAVKGFIDFIRGPKGRKIIEASSAIALK
jgi:phosphate transport system substrate-binding protein